MKRKTVKEALTASKRRRRLEGRQDDDEHNINHDGDDDDDDGSSSSDDEELMAAAAAWADQDANEPADGNNSDSSSHQDEKGRKRSKCPKKNAKAASLNPPAPQPPEPEPTTTATKPITFSLHITQLAFDATEFDIQNLFLSKGCVVTSVRMVCDYDQESKQRTFRGVAFVDVADQRSYDIALKQLHKHAFLGRRINVRPTKTKQELGSIVERTKELVAKKIKDEIEKRQKHQSEEVGDSRTSSRKTETSLITASPKTKHASKVANKQQRKSQKLKAVPKKKGSNNDRKLTKKERNRRAAIIMQQRKRRKR